MTDRSDATLVVRRKWNPLSPEEAPEGTPLWQIYYKGKRDTFRYTHPDGTPAADRPVTFGQCKTPFKTVEEIRAFARFVDEHPDFGLICGREQDELDPESIALDDEGRVTFRMRGLSTPTPQTIRTRLDRAHTHLWVHELPFEPFPPEWRYWNRDRPLTLGEVREYYDRRGLPLPENLVFVNEGTFSGPSTHGAVGDRRTDTATARRMIEGLLPDPAARRAVLELMVACIRENARRKPGTWSVTLHASAGVSLNIGGGFYCAHIQKGRAQFFYLTLPEIADTRPYDHPFATYPEVRRSRLAESELAEGVPLLTPGVLAFVRSAVDRYDRLNSKIARAHSPGVLRYIEEELDLDEPLPTPIFPTTEPNNREAPQSFSWLPMYDAVADKVLEYRGRSGELLELLRSALSGLSLISLNDQNPKGVAIPLTEIDPFTFFANFSRQITWSNRTTILKRLKEAWNLPAPPPYDYEGVPLVNNQSTWFFAYGFLRAPQDIELLWEIAVVAREEGADGISPELWNACLAIRQVAIAKLTIGLFWLNPTEFLALDQNTRQYLARHGVNAPASPTVEQYRQLLNEVRETIGSDFVAISAAAYASPAAQTAGAEGSRYWAGGHYWSTGSKLEEFLAENAWWHGWTSPEDSKEAAKAFKNFGDINVGDFFAVKGYGGRNDLRVRMVGRVIDKDDDNQRVELAPLSLPRPVQIRPARGTGSWFGTLREVTDPEVIRWMFHGEPYTEAVEDAEREQERPSRPVRPLNTILYGPPGTGKTFATIRRAVEIADPKFDSEGAEHQERKARFDELRAAGRIEFVTFHQSFGYEEFVEGIRPVMDATIGDGSPRYTVQDGILKQIALRALAAILEPIGDDDLPEDGGNRATLSEEARRNAARDYLRLGEASGYRLKPEEDEWPRFVLVIDEINRGNISKILGELITLVEDDKRVGAENSLTVTLPYSRETFGLPANLHLLGTMNTADKSIALVDIALRRRFAFEELTPNFDDSNVCRNLTPEMRAVLNELNRRIGLRLDRDHRIGHAYFVPVASVEQFNEVFRRRIIPLLQEYFYNDWDGLRFALGETASGGGDGRFLVRQDKEHGSEARTRWQWCTDAGTPLDGVTALKWLMDNYPKAEKSSTE